jgi:hypothetical protein
MNGEYSFPKPEWNGVSKTARWFVSQLMCVDVAARLTAEAALAHPWIRGGLLPSARSPLPAAAPVAEDVPSNAAAVSSSDESLEHATPATPTAAAAAAGAAGASGLALPDEGTSGRPAKRPRRSPAATIAVGSAAAAAGGRSDMAGGASSADSAGDSEESALSGPSSVDPMSQGYIEIDSLEAAADDDSAAEDSIVWSWKTSNRYVRYASEVAAVIESGYEVYQVRRSRELARPRPALYLRRPLLPDVRVRIIQGQLPSQSKNRVDVGNHIINFTQMRQIRKDVRDATPPPLPPPVCCVHLAVKTLPPRPICRRSLLLRA